MGSKYWCGHKILDPSDIERQFSNEDSLGHLDVSANEFLSEERTEQLEQVKTVLDSIPPREADFVELYFFQRVRQTAIAAIFNVSQPTVCYRLQRAASRIRYLLDMPEYDRGQIRPDLEGVLGDPVDVEIMLAMIKTTCQSEVAKNMGVTQGFVRHRFLRSVAAMQTMAHMDNYVDLFNHVSANLNILREVQRAKWSEPVIHLIS
jgi:predicted DNA-binding protein (UPF0251 family)